MGILPVAIAARVPGAAATARQTSGSGSLIWSLPPSFAPTDTFRPQLEAALGIVLPAWPIVDGWTSLVAAFLLLDLLRYFVHRCRHALPFLWRFHALHHSYPDVDVTTSVRVHPIEHVLNSVVFWLTAMLLGIPANVGLLTGSQRSPSRPSSTVTFACRSGWTGACSRSWAQSTCTASPLRRVRTGELQLRNCFLSLSDRLFGSYTRLKRAQHDSIVFGVREAGTA